MDSSVCLDSRLWNSSRKETDSVQINPKIRSAPRMFSKSQSVTISNLDMLGCCWSCRGDPFRQWQSRNTMWHTGVISVEYVKTFAWNDGWGSWSVKDLGEFWCFLTGYYKYFDSCKLCVECRQCKRTIGHFTLHDNFRLFRRVQDWVVYIVRFSYYSNIISDIIKAVKKRLHPK